MKARFSQILIIAILTCAVTFAPIVAQAGELGHFVPGLASIRDYTVPAPGFYGALYNYWYKSDQLNNTKGKKINSVTINPGPGPGVTLGVNTKVDVYAASPMFLWVSNWEILGAKYAAYIAPSFAKSSLSASLFILRRGRTAKASTRLDLGDLFVQPLWLGWSPTHWDFALGYGFYAPVGKYNTKTITLPIIGSIKSEAADNIGLGFWTNQVQGAVSAYPWADKRMALSTVLTYEIHGKKKGFDLTPGQNLALNWGISQYLTMCKNKTLLLELGPAGYSSWQMKRDRGRDASKPNVLSLIHI